MSVSLVFSSAQMIGLSVELLAEHRRFFVSLIYGLNLARERVSLWNDLRALFLQLGSSAWVLMGDFNVVRSPDERIVGLDEVAASDFNNCLADICMHNMVTKGYWFTWTNKRGGLRDNKSRLDRVLVNDGWLDLFRDSEVVGHAPGVSDHCALVLTVVHNRYKACPFRFFNFWMADSRFGDLLGSSWGKVVRGNPMERLSLKLKGLKPVLKAFHKQHYGNLNGWVMAARKNLSKIQRLCFRFSHDQFLCDLEKDLVQQFYALSQAEESYKKQKSRVNWLALGDKNTRFFHQKMNAHRVRNTILSLVNDQGVRLEDPSDIEDEILGYYQGLLGSEFTQKRDATVELSAAIQHKMMSPESVPSAMPPPVEEEVWSGDTVVAEVAAAAAEAYYIIRLFT
ncbi:hypothetical protein Vadar_016806 [Vaccinium darrowii]|uniref:Uncharacterized protein n=1 Tax=Vaccinium darrowii TaxID=229202 RepID=A0ACB7YWL6_9ERIC|nr:hypothetical protein Vadar_016806 [Vaccinium darrowii]